ncbi:hypothetical protein NQ315_010555 [Exocentrus adspersus]|uniref:LisH domain-containing protein n=1 Tax=Exocentrus adspersus TaxID=1586481 RepID=A0AAV8W4U5_9CUCU|nr:hypothetical protein NQ315_010555 [Exocentrus adspersus]
METTEVVIARLVLGYLKEQKCRTAYKEFLRTSHNFQKHGSVQSRYIPTRFLGLTLEDILREYFEISKIVQGRLEATNYYNECNSRATLIQQLLYLLNRTQSSRTSTPCPRSPLGSNICESSPSPIEHISDVETTPAHTLPGNTQYGNEESYLYKSSRRKSNSRSSHKSGEAVESKPTEQEEKMLKVLAQTLLENKEFQEKIAQSINKVAEKYYSKSAELDKTIKTVVKETEADPMFDQILEEIIGSTATLEHCKNVETSSTTSSATKEVIDDTGSKEKRSNNCTNSSKSGSDLDQNLTTHSHSQRVDQQNEEAIHSIVASSKLSNSNSTENNQAVQVNNDVTVFDGSLDKYLANTCTVNTQTQPLGRPLYVNTSTPLVMIPPGIISTDSFQLDPTKQYYIVNKQPVVNFSVPPIQTANIVTEQDILAMPTIIVNDEKQSTVINSQRLSQVPTAVTNKTNKSIVPKPTIGIPAEYATSAGISGANYGGRSRQQKGLKNVMYPKKTKTVKPQEKPAGTVKPQEKPAGTVKLQETPAGESTDKNDTKTVIPSKECKSLPDLLNEEPLSEITSSKQMNPVNVQKVTGQELMTPAPTTETAQKTPKSGSHVRNLNFSTPVKTTSTHEKSSRNEVDGTAEARPTSSVHINQATKSLFVSENHTSDKDEEKKSETKNTTNSKTWDADLRALILLKEEQQVKKKGRTNKIVAKHLNTTEQDAAVIEAALQTPTKSDGNHENVISKDNENKEDEKCSDNTKNLADESNTNKTVLSPSKLNANKRNLVSSDVTDDNTNLTKSIDEKSKFITPEMKSENFHYPIKSNRNITSMFDTPLKDEPVPKTPGFHSPNNSLNTPFSKMLEANLKGIDISSLPTPNIPVTPGFPPYTPDVDTVTPYSNRTTDYSASSSYYLPSDSEPNRSLEVNITEIEKQPVKVLSSIVIQKKLVKITEEQGLANVNTNNSHTTKSIVNEHLNVFNRNVIGKKNLNLIDRKAPVVSSSSDDSSDENNTSSGSWMEKDNDTVICNKKPMETPKRTYSLRSRTTTVKREDTKSPIQTSKVKSNKKQTNQDTSPVSRTAHKHETVEKETKRAATEIPKKSTENIYSQAELKKELTEKLVRTVNKLKSTEKSSSKRSSKASNSKFKIKLVDSKKSKKKVKPNTGKKCSQREGSLESIIDDIDEIKKQSQNTNDLEKTDKSASDIESQNLIEGLKERGIHLMKKKSNKQADETSNVSTTINCDTSDEPVNTVNKTNEQTGLEKSSSELEMERREIYDTKTFEEFECVVFDESKTVVKTFEDYDTKILEKKFSGKVFIEEIDKEKQAVTNKKSKTLNKRLEGQTNPKVNTKTENKQKQFSENRLNDSIKRPFDEEKVEASVKRRKVEVDECFVPEEKHCKKTPAKN